MFSLFKHKKDKQFENDSENELKQIDNELKIHENAPTPTINDNKNITMSKELNNQNHASEIPISSVNEQGNTTNSDSIDETSGYDCRKNNLEYRPSRNGLYPDEILMLFMASQYKMENNIFPRYWKFRYNVDNPQEILNLLEEDEFITRGGVKEALLSLTLKDLKAELTSHNLKASGKKEDLVNRLITECGTAELDAKYPNKPYILTDLGNEELKQNEYVYYLHNNQQYSIGIWEMNNRLNYNNPKNLKYRDILWEELLKNGLAYLQKGNYGLYRNTRYDMFKLVMEEERYSAAFNLLSEILYLDLSGLDNSWNIYLDNQKLHLEMLLRHSFPYLNEDNTRSVSSLPQAAIDDWLPSLKDKLNITSYSEYYELLLAQFNDMKKRYPFHLFTPDECANICIWEMNKDIEKLSEVYHHAELRIQERYREI